MRPQNDEDAIILGKRDEWHIRIEEFNAPHNIVRIITEGYDKNSYLTDQAGAPASIKQNRNRSPHGIYDLDTVIAASADYLHGTSAYWDGVQDQNGGGNDGKAVAGDYRAVLVVNGLATGSPSAKMTAVAE